MCIITRNQDFSVMRFYFCEVSKPDFLVLSFPPPIFYSSIVRYDGRFHTRWLRGVFRL